MKLSELAALMGKSKEEVKDILDNQDTVQLDLKERKKTSRDNGNIEVIS